MKKSTLLIATADALLKSDDYHWNSPSRCNVGHLIECARGFRPTIPEFFQGGNSGLRLGPKTYAVWCRVGEDNHVIAWLKAEYGFTAREIESIECLNDPTIVRTLARRGILSSPMFNRSRLYVAEYLRAMGRRIARRERRAQPAPRQLVIA